MTSQGKPGSARPGAAPGVEVAAKRIRGAYRRHLTAADAGPGGVPAEARRAAAVILEVLAGVRTPSAAAAALGIGAPRYYLLEERAIRGLVAACAPRPKGRTPSSESRLAQLERELASTRRELARQQALARTAQRALGLTAAAGASSAASGKAPAHSAAAEPGPRRRRKPAARGLRAARLLRAGDSAGAGAALAVQPADGSPSAAGPAGGAGRPAATDAPGVAPRADQGGDSHAGREEAAVD